MLGGIFVFGFGNDYTFHVQNLEATALIVSSPHFPLLVFEQNHKYNSFWLKQTGGALSGTIFVHVTSTIRDEAASGRFYLESAATNHYRPTGMY